MVDWKKEIKLSDLVGRKRKREDTQDVVGRAPETDETTDAVARVHAAVPAAEHPAPPLSAEPEFSVVLPAPEEATVELPPADPGAAPVGWDSSSAALSEPAEPSDSRSESVLPAHSPWPLDLGPSQPVAEPVAASPPADAAPPAAPGVPFATHDSAPTIPGTPPPPSPQGAPPLLTAPPVPAPSPLPGIHPPVPASALEPEPELESPTKDSFLKKEISFRRKPKEPKAAGGTSPGGQSSRLRGEISLRRKPSEETSPEPNAAPKTARKPFWRRELAFARKPPVLKRRGAKAPQAERKPRLERLRPRGAGAPARRERGSHRHYKRLVGLKIGASQLAAARVANNGVPELVQVAREELEPGTVVGGELREPEILAEAMREFFRRHKLPRQEVRLGIANNRIGVRLFDITGVEEPRQLENAIRFRAQEALPIPIEEAVLDYHVLRETVDEEGVTTRRILLVVAYRELIDRYVAACKKAGIRLVGIDLEAFALLRALGEPPAEASSDAALVVVSIGHDRSTFAVSDGRVCEFTRVLDWGGSTLNVAIARALDIAPSEAEPIKRSLSLLDQSLPTGLTEEQGTAALDAVRRSLQSFARELVSSLQFYQNQPGSLGIGEIVLTGGTAHLTGLGEELQRLIGVSVRTGDPLARVRVGKRIAEPEQLGSLAVAIGLGIED